MNKRISKFYLSIKHGKAVFVAINLTELIRRMRKIEPNLKSNSYYEKGFKKSNIMYFTNKETGAKYTFQKIENEKD